jgi:hypothetical protein
LDKKNAAKILEKLKLVEVAHKVYTFDCAYDPEKEVRALIEATQDAKGQFSGNVTIRMFSRVKTQDHYAFANVTDPDLFEFILFDQVGFFKRNTSLVNCFPFHIS